MKTAKRRKELCRRGKRGDVVRAVVDATEKRVIVYYRDADGIEHKAKFPDTKEGRSEAVAFVEGWHLERERMAREKLEGVVATPMALREVITAFKNAEYSDTDGEGLRKATQVSYTNHLKRFELFFGRDRAASTIKKHEIAEFVKAERKTGRALNQVRQTLNVVRLVFRWAIEHELLTHSPLAVLRWKKRNDMQKPLEPGEFTTEEFEKMLRQLDRADARQWRGWVFLMLVGHHGQRANAVLHLRWSDVDMDRGVIVWPARYQKQGKDFEQPLLWESISALRTAQAWREKALTYRVLPHHKSPNAGPAALAESDWVLFAERDKAKPMSYQSMHYHLIQAEKRAGLTHKAYAAAHAFRRMVVGNVIDATGDRMMGLEYVGDTDVKQLKSYDRRRAQRVAAASATVGANAETPAPVADEDAIS